MACRHGLLGCGYRLLTVVRGSLTGQVSLLYVGDLCVTVVWRPVIQRERLTSWAVSEGVPPPPLTRMPFEPGAARSPPCIDHSNARRVRECAIATSRCSLVCLSSPRVLDCWLASLTRVLILVASAWLRGLKAHWAAANPPECTVCFSSERLLRGVNPNTRSARNELHKSAGKGQCFYGRGRAAAYWALCGFANPFTRETDCALAGN